MASFIDRVVLHLAAGNGGHGVASIHREKFKPLGGPDGGNGGRGGDVVLVVDPNVHTLLDFHHHPHQRAGNGKQGAGSHRNGAEGADLELRVPDGTVVLDGDGEVLADLTGVGTRFVAARGGRGGLGNAALASTRRKAPGFALLGEPGEARDVVLELKSVADVGLVGFPSAGKSSLIAAMSAARPEDRRLPVHHAGAEPRRRQRRRHHLHRRRRARADPGRGRRARASAWSSCATSSAARCCCTCSTAPRSSPAATRSATSTRIEAELAQYEGTLRRSARQAAPGRAEQDRRARGARAGRARPPGPRGPRPAGVRDLGGRARRACAS